MERKGSHPPEPSPCVALTASPQPPASGPSLGGSLGLIPWGCHGSTLKFLGLAENPGLALIPEGRRVSDPQNAPGCASQRRSSLRGTEAPREAQERALPLCAQSGPGTWGGLGTARRRGWRAGLASLELRSKDRTAPIPRWPLPLEGGGQCVQGLRPQEGRALAPAPRLRSGGGPREVSRDLLVKSRSAKHMSLRETLR